MSKSSTNTQQNLDELAKEFDTLVEALETDDPTLREQAAQLMEQIVPQLSSKIDGYVAIIGRKRASADIRQNEAKRLSQLAAADTASADWLTEKLKLFLEQRVELLGDKGKRLEGLYCQISLATNGGKEPVWIDPNIHPDDLPQQFVRTLKEVDTEALRCEVRSSGEMRDRTGRVIARIVERGRHVRIR